MLISCSLNSCKRVKPKPLALLNFFSSAGKAGEVAKCPLFVLFRLVWQISDVAVEVPIERLIRLVEKTILSRQASYSVIYCKRLSILSNISKQPRKKALLLRKSDCYLFGKKIRTHIDEIEKSKKITQKYLDVQVFRSTRKLFQRGPCQFNQECCVAVGGRFVCANKLSN